MRTTEMHVGSFNNANISSFPPFLPHFVLFTFFFSLGSHIRIEASRFAGVTVNGGSFLFRLPRHRIYVSHLLFLPHADSSF